MVALILILGDPPPQLRAADAWSDLITFVNVAKDSVLKERRVVLVFDLWLIFLLCFLARKPRLEVPVEVAIGAHYNHERVGNRINLDGRSLGNYGWRNKWAVLPNVTQDFSLS